MNALVEQAQARILETLYSYIHAFRSYASGKRGHLYIRYHKGTLLTFSVSKEPFYTTWYLGLSFPYLRTVSAHWINHEYADIRIADDYKVSYDGDHVIIDKQRFKEQRETPANHKFSSKILMCRILDTADAWYELDVTNSLKTLKVPSDITLGHLLPYLTWVHQSRLVSFDTCRMEILWDETFEEEMLTADMPMKHILESIYSRLQ